MKDLNAMLKSILVMTADRKPQTTSIRLPFAVNAMLKVPSNLESSLRLNLVFTTSFLYSSVIFGVLLVSGYKVGPHEGTCCRNMLLQNVAGTKSR